MPSIYTLLNNQDIAQLEQYLIENPEMVNHPNPEDACGWSLLHCSCYIGNIYLTKLLLERGADFHLKDDMQWTPLHVAALANQLETIKLLIQKGADVNCLTGTGNTILHIAAKNGFENLVLFLSNCENISLTTKTSAGLCAIDLAISYGQLDCVKALMTHQLATLPTEHPQKFIKSAIKHGDFMIMNYFLLTCQFDSDFLFSKESNLSLPHNMWFYLNIYRKLKIHVVSDNIVTQLSQCPNFLEIKFAILELLVYFRRYELDAFETFIKNIYQHEHWSHEKRAHIIHMLRYCEKGSLQRLLKCFDNSIDYRNVDGTGKTLLLLAIEWDSLTLALASIALYGHELLKQTDNQGNGLVHYCCRFNAIQCFDYFLGNVSYRIDVDNQNHAGETGVHLAAVHEHIELLKKLLLDCQAIPDIKDKEGNTPLHTAVLSRKLNSVDTIISFNQQVALENREGLTVLELGQQSQHPGIIHYLSSTLLSIAIPREPEMMLCQIDTLVFQGGGVKGAAFYGAMKTLISKKYFKLENIHRVAGTSAGAISALLLAVGYNLGELNDILSSLNFEELLEKTHRQLFFDLKADYTKNGLQGVLGHELYQFVKQLMNSDNPKKAILQLMNLATNNVATSSTLLRTFLNELNLRNVELETVSQQLRKFITRVRPLIDKINKDKGLFKGEALRQKFKTWIEAKGHSANLTFAELKDLVDRNKDGQFKELYVFDYNADTHEEVCFCAENNNTANVSLADAVRGSMSIQALFEPFIINGQRYFDGGSMNNYFLNYFDKVQFIKKPTTNFFSPSNQNKSHYKQTNTKALGLRLVNSELFRRYEYGTPLPQQSPDAGILNFLMDILTSLSTFTKQESDYQLHPDEIERTVHIDTLDIETADFDLNQEAIRQLISSGSRCADAFLARQQTRHSTINNGSFQETISPGILLSKLAKQHDRIQTQMDTIYNILCDENFDLNAIKELIQQSHYPICSRDKNGNNICHKSIERGSLVALEKIHKISPKLFSMKNYADQYPLDYIIFCKDEKIRKEIVQSCLVQDKLYATLLEENTKLQSPTDKKQFILKQAASYQRSRQTSKEEEVTSYVKTSNLN